MKAARVTAPTATTGLDRVRRFLSVSAVRLYAHLTGTETDMSGTDMSMREAERLAGEIEQVNGRQVARRRDLEAALRTAAEAKRAAEAMALAVATLKGIPTKPERLARIITEAESLLPTDARTQVEAERKVLSLNTEFASEGRRLLALGNELQKFIRAAEVATVTAACSRARQLGEEDAATFRADPFLVSAPQHAPDSVRQHYAEAMQLAELADSPRVEKAYRIGCGDYSAVIQQAVTPGARAMGLGSRQKETPLMEMTL